MKYTIQGEPLPVVICELEANETFTAFADKNEPVYEPPPMPDYDFESNNQEFPF